MCVHLQWLCTYQGPILYAETLNSFITRIDMKVIHIMLSYSIVLLMPLSIAELEDNSIYSSIIFSIVYVFHVQGYLGWYKAFIFRL